MNTFSQDRAEFKLFLRELGINQQQASIMMGLKPNSLARTISLAKEQGRDFPAEIISIMNFVRLWKKEPQRVDGLLSLINNHEEAFPDSMLKIASFTEALKKEINILQ